MVIMKLYTEEQVREAFIAGMEFIAVIPLKYEQDANKYMNSITPIELPNDEEIASKIENMEGISLEIEVGYRAGARWMRNKILNK